MVRRLLGPVIRLFKVRGADCDELYDGGDEVRGEDGRGQYPRPPTGTRAEDKDYQGQTGYYISRFKIDH